MFHKFDHYGNENCAFTRFYASLFNKYKGIDSLVILRDGLSFNINSDSFNFKCTTIKVKQEESAW